MSGNTHENLATRVLALFITCSEEHFEMGILVDEIPEEQLPSGDLRLTLQLLCLSGRASVYTPLGSTEWNVWFNSPIGVRITVREWVARVTLATEN